MAKHITPAQRKQIQRLQADGHTLTAIATQLGVDRHTVGAHAEPQAPVPAHLPLDAARLAYLLAGLELRLSCAKCKQPMFWAKYATEGSCNWCGAGNKLSAPALAGVR